MAKEKKKAVPKKAAPKKSVSDISTFKAGLKYPWGNPKRLWNVLWVLIPIIGWLALLGYCQSIVRAIVAGNKTGLPEFVGFGDNLKRGFILFVKILPLMIAYNLVYSIPGIGFLTGFIAEVFFIPYLVINLFVTDKFEESFNLKKTWNAVFNNLGDYFTAYLKTIGFVILYGLLSIILIGFPGFLFGQLFFLVEFYRNHS
ncbi:MAG: DUF4013 domain-containing protein [Nanoarchaeota archaeon]|nr:DUF4013 domain-containing protein [Nanoarchaeota archaeon]